MTPEAWEIAALVAAVIVGLVVRFAGGAVASRVSALVPSRVHAVATAAAARTPPLAWDALLVGVGLAVHLGALFRAWDRVSRFRSPMGADADANYLAAVALERGDLALYAGDRYPAYPALVALLADGTEALHTTGAYVSMAAAVGTIVLVYAIAARMGGRAAGLVALFVCARLPGVADAGRQFTPYALVAFADLLGVAGLLAMGAGGPARVAGGAVAVALGAATAFAADPKQAPVALALVGIGVVLAVREGVGGAEVAEGGAAEAVAAQRALVRSVALRAALGLAAALPIANTWIATANLPIFSVVEITTRVDLGLDLDPGLGSEGWTLGDSVFALPGELLRLAAGTEVDAGRAWLHPVARASLPMELPRTTVLWLALGLLAFLPGSRRGGYRGWHGAVALAPLALVAWSALHLHFQHRYAVPFVAVLPVLAAVGVARVCGPAGVLAAALVALVHPGSPWRGVAPGLVVAAPNGADGWAGVEPPDWTTTLARAAAALPPDALVLDFAQSQPWTMLAGARPYVRCTTSKDNCRGLLEAPTGTLVAVLFPGEGVSAALPEASSLTTFRLHAPERVGTCWEGRVFRMGNGGAYAWTCADPPRLPLAHPAPPRR